MEVAFMRHRARWNGVLWSALGATVAVGLTAGAAWGQADFRPRFRAETPFAVGIGSEPGRQALALADVNGDQVPDLVTIDDEAVAVQLNDGQGGFGAPALLAVDAFPTSVAVADVAAPLNGGPDGIADLLVGDDLGQLTIIPGSGAGAFDELDAVLFDELETFEILGLAVLDLDGQGGADLALLDVDGLLLLCNAAGALAPCGGGEPLPVSDDPIEILTGDFNGDAHADLVVLDRSAQLVFPFYGDGAGAVTPATSVPVRGEADDGFAVDMAVARADDDQIDDVVVANYDQNFQFLAITLLGDTRSRFRALSFVIDFEAAALAVGDFDADDLLDAIVGYADSGVTVNIGEGGGALFDPFTPVGSNQVGTVALLAAGDLNGDEVLDLLVVNGNGDGARVLMNATGPFCAGDCNADGEVTIDELMRAVNIALGLVDRRECIAVDVDSDGEVEIHELVGAVDLALDGCPVG
jgi:hypothetical protein